MSKILLIGSGIGFIILSVLFGAFIFSNLSQINNVNAQEQSRCTVTQLDNYLDFYYCELPYGFYKWVQCIVPKPTGGTNAVRYPSCVWEGLK